jgi:hypothetical protein
VQQISQGDGAIWVVRDDLLHPIVGGNKYRKLDAVIPRLLADGVQHVVSGAGRARRGGEGPRPAEGPGQAPPTAELSQ